jgi:hypothetical protein
VTAADERQPRIVERIPVRDGDRVLEGASEQVLAIHLPVLDRGDPSAELRRVRGALAPGGRLVIGFQPLDPAARPAAERRLATVLAANAFAVVETVRGDPGGRPTAVLFAAPS